MRTKRTSQISINEIYAKHEIVDEFGNISKPVGGRAGICEIPVAMAIDFP